MRSRSISDLEYPLFSKETGFNIITNFWSEATGLPRIWDASLSMRAVRKLPFDLCLFVKMHQRLKRKQKFKKIDNDDTPRVCYNNLRMVSDRRQSGVPALLKERSVPQAGAGRSGAHRGLDEKQDLTDEREG